MRTVLLTFALIYAIVKGILKKKPMKKNKEEQEVSKLVNWCLDRSEKLNDADGLALLHEFDEWISYEAEEIEEISITRIKADS